MGRPPSFLTRWGATLLCLCSALSVPGRGDACPSPSWVPFNSSCYAVLSATQNSLSIEPARDLCRDVNADIISVNSKEENSFLVKMFQTKWKGPTEILLGMFYDSDDNSLKWLDKSEVTFYNWGEVRLTDKNLDTCVKMNTGSGLWDVTDCDRFTESAVLCKYIPKESPIIDKKALKVSLVAIFTVLTLGIPIAIIILHKKNWSSSLHRTPARPYSDGAFLVDTMESEDYA